MSGSLRSPVQVLRRMEISALVTVQDCRTKRGRKKEMQIQRDEIAFKHRSQHNTSNQHTAATTHSRLRISLRTASLVGYFFAP